MIDWLALTAIFAGCGVIGAVFLFSTRSIVRDEIRKLNGTYLRTEVAEVRFQQIEDHFDYLRNEAKKSRAHGAD